jgi:tryptophanyl-tRNA synthetase
MVGDDQNQHVEITRDIGERMNHKFGELFTVPEDWKHQLEFASLDSGVRIRSLVNPEKKMSKSVSDPRGTILLSDSPADAAKKIMGATTDSVNAIHFDWDNQPGITNLLQILSLLSNTPQAEVTATWEGNDHYGDLKKAVAEQVEKFLTDFQARFHAIDDSALMAKLESSEAAMNVTANETLLRVQRAVGLRPKA